MQFCLTKKDKLLERFFAQPKDFSYQELKTLLNSLGYEESNLGKTSGSRVLFLNVIKQSKIRIHKPHPGNILKKYQIVEVISKITSKEK